MTSDFLTPPPLPQPGKPLWVFAYGSLIWNPEFPYVARHTTVLEGWHRRFCIRSTRYRGTTEAPGLVLGLDEGGCCTGITYEVAPSDANMTLQYLWSREMFSGVYIPRWLTVDTAKGPQQACTFVARRDHPNYVELGLEEQAKIIASACGQRGSNFDYLHQTVTALNQLELADTHLSALLELSHEAV